MMDQVSIRSAELSDLERLLEFEQAIIEAERPLDETIRSGPGVHYYDLEGLISSPDALVVVAEQGAEVIGAGYARIEGSEPYLKHNRHSYLGCMYTIPAHRGEGVNGKVMAALEEWSRSRGVTEMKLEVYSENAAAVRAYEKSGYSRLILTMLKELV